MKSGQKAALVIRLFYEESSREAELRMLSGKSPDLSPNLGYPTTGKVAEELAKKAGIGRSSMEYLIAVSKKRPDLFELVFNGEYSINRAYTQMKAALVVRLFYEEERQKAEVRRASTLVQNTDSPDLDEREKTRTDVALAKKAGRHSNM